MNVTLLQINHEIGSEGIDIKVSEAFGVLEVQDKALETAEKYKEVLIEMTNELLDVLREGARNCSDVEAYSEHEED